MDWLFALKQHAPRGGEFSILEHEPPNASGCLRREKPRNLGWREARAEVALALPREGLRLFGQMSLAGDAWRGAFGSHCSGFRGILPGD